MNAPPPNPIVLAVDLDGTLLRSDMLYETFWAALRQNWLVPLFCARALLRGRAALKEYLRTCADIDVRTLPFDEAVIAFVKAHRAALR